jgi:hypothetical protein
MGRCPNSKQSFESLNQGSLNRWQVTKFFEKILTFVSFFWGQLYTSWDRWEF